jgi:hypothetical protein
MTRLPLLTLAGAALLATSACAATRGDSLSREELLSSAPEPAGARTCRVVDQPVELPTPAQLVDVAALTSDLRELASRREVSAGHALLTLWYDADGLNIRREVIEHSLPPVVADSLQRLVFAHRKELDLGEEPWGVRLRADIGEPIELRVGRQEYCDPVPRSQSLAHSMHTVERRDFRIRGRTRESTVYVRAVVDGAGRVTQVDLQHAPIAGSLAQQAVRDYLRTLFFDPATLDGFPVHGVVRIPVRVRS